MTQKKKIFQTNFFIRWPPPKKKLWFAGGGGSLKPPPTQFPPKKPPGFLTMVGGHIKVGLFKEKKLFFFFFFDAIGKKTLIFFPLGGGPKNLSNPPQKGTIGGKSGKKIPQKKFFGQVCFFSVWVFPKKNPKRAVGPPPPPNPPNFVGRGGGTPPQFPKGDLGKEDWVWKKRVGLGGKKTGFLHLF